MGSSVAVWLTEETMLGSRVDAWMGVRERLWLTGACRASSEMARPVGRGTGGKRVDFGTNPVGIMGRCGSLATRPVGTGTLVGRVDAGMGADGWMGVDAWGVFLSLYSWMSVDAWMGVDAGMGVEAWMGVRERFWPAGACRATSETAKPVGTGTGGERVDSGTNPVGDRGRCGSLATRPVGMGKYPVPTGCRGGLATRPLAECDSASDAKKNEEVPKTFMLLEGMRMEAETASAFQ